MDINIFRKFLGTITESVIVTDKIGKRGINGADGWIKVKNAEFKDRALWLPDDNDRSFWNSSELKGVYRFYVNDNPKNHPQFTGSGLLKLDVEAGTVQTLDKDKYMKANERLNSSVWGRPYKVSEVVVFNKDFLKHQ